MKRLFFAFAMLLVATMSFGQTARQVLDKCAATLNSKDGMQANFTMSSAQYGSASGTIAIKGQKFHATTNMAAMWFDGKTQWTYMKKNDEVSVTNPSQAQLEAINPYHFINMYKNGYSYTMTTDANSYKVHLTSTGKNSRIGEMFITIDKQTSHPTEVKLLQGKKWTTFVISDLKKVKMADSAFQFNSKDFPKAEVIDLR